MHVEEWEGRRESEWVGGRCGRVCVRADGRKSGWMGERADGRAVGKEGRREGR